MNYYAYIKGTNYNLIQGFSISEEYNETLDSGTIMISNVPQLDINPYDDVYIYSNDEELYSPFDFKQCSFYKHFLIDQFQEEVIRLGELYRYTINLFSETKGLENVQLPNISITQPLDASKKVSTLEYVKRFLTMYNKMVKVQNGEIQNGECYFWKYKQRYRLSNNDNGMLESIANVFKNSYTPDFTLNNPNLRDVLSKLLITKDRIPVVKDNYVYCLDITKRRGKFNTNVGEINYIYGSKSSDNYCSDLRRNYSDALAQDYTGKYTEFLGFRNSSSPLLTLANMRIETKFPIYKINKLYMCYYKKGQKKHLNTNETKNIVFLCKQDITPLVKLNSERNCLSEDIKAFNNEKEKTIETLSKYKLATVGYDIGSNYIDGWGTVYNYPGSFFEQNLTSSYIENIFNFVNKKTPLGISNLFEFINYYKNQGENVDDIAFLFNDGKITDVMATPDYNKTLSTLQFIIDDDNLDVKNETICYKSLFFEIEYQPFYSGVIIQSKEFGKENITINDNASSSLTLLELDGLAQKEKINRFGNKGIQINARYTNINDLQPLGSVFEDDVIIYHKEYSINDNVVNCTYYGTKDYVLKNYYTSVYAKHRTYNLMSYGESVTRCENERNYFLFSKTRQYYDSNPLISSFNFNKNNFCNKLFNFYEGFSSYDDVLNQKRNEINFAYFKKIKKDKDSNTNDDNVYWLTDSNIFISGNSLCMNMKMSDNVVAGVSIANIISDYSFKDTSTYVTGGKQKWVWMPDDATNDTSETGTIKNLGFYFGHNDSLFNDDLILEDIDIDKKYDKLFSLPQVNEEIIVDNEIGINKTIYKDNKEVIDMTFQFEALNDKGIFLSPWIFKLSDLYNVYPKYNKTFEVKRDNGDINFFGFIANTLSNKRYPILCALIKKETLSQMVTYKKESDFSNEISIKFDKTDKETLEKDSGYGIYEATWDINGYNSISFDTDKYKINFNIKEIFEQNQNHSESNFYREWEGNREFISYYDDNHKIIPYYNIIDPSEQDIVQKDVKLFALRKILGKYDITDKEMGEYIIFYKIWNTEEDFHQSERYWIAYPDSIYYKNHNNVFENFWNNEKILNKLEVCSDFNKETIDFNINNIYNQNLFFYFTNDDFKEYMIYDELIEIPNTYRELIYEKYGSILGVNKITVNNENGDLKFHYNIDENINENSKILIYYKKDNKYNFVFGFNILPLGNNDCTLIHISTLSTKDDTIYDESDFLPIAKMLNVVGTDMKNTVGATDQSTKEDYNSNWPHDFDYGGGIVPPSEKKITVRFYNNINSTNYNKQEYIGVPTLIERPKDPVRDGYIFQFWALDGVEFDFENTKVYNNISLYATWKAENHITVTYYAFDNLINSEIVAYGHMASKPQNPTKDGYIFKWWYEYGKDENLEFNFDTPLYENLMLNSKWSRAYKVTYKVSGYDDVIDWVEIGEKINQPENPIKQGQKFLGWYTEDGELFNFDSIINSDIILTAKFEVIQVKVEFYITRTEKYQTKWIDVGSKVTKPETDPTREGYTFDGWDFDFDTVITNDTTIYAKWLGSEYLYISLHTSSDDNFNINTKALKDITKNSDGFCQIRFYDATSSSPLGQISMNNNNWSSVNAGIDGGTSIVPNQNYHAINKPSTYNGLPAIRFISSSKVGVGPYSLAINWSSGTDNNGDYWCILIDDTYYQYAEVTLSYASNITGIRIEKHSVIESNGWNFERTYVKST